MSENNSNRVPFIRKRGLYAEEACKFVSLRYEVLPEGVQAPLPNFRALISPLLIFQFSQFGGGHCWRTIRWKSLDWRLSPVMSSSPFFLSHKHRKAGFGV